MSTTLSNDYKTLLEWEHCAAAALIADWPRLLANTVKEEILETGSDERALL